MVLQKQKRTIRNKNQIFLMEKQKNSNNKLLQNKKQKQKIRHIFIACNWRIFPLLSYENGNKLKQRKRVITTTENLFLVVPLSGQTVKMTLTFIRMGNVSVKVGKRKKE